MFQCFFIICSGLGYTVGGENLFFVRVKKGLYNLSFARSNCHSPHRTVIDIREFSHTVKKNHLCFFCFAECYEWNACDLCATIRSRSFTKHVAADGNKTQR